MKIRKMYPNAKMSSVVHEFSEAPWHWKIRQKMINAFCDGIIVNSRADFDGVRQKTKPVIRTTLGPTLYIESLLKNPQAESIASTQKTYRQEMITAFGLPSSGAWVLHPGLVTPGKGVNVLKNFEKALRETDSLIVMGGLGPKQRDRDYAQTVTDQLKSIYGQRFVFLENLSDDIFQKMLLSSDLVLLPYDEGVSERRSSFLSALSCGANVWTTLGVYSPELKLEVSGVHSALISAIGTQALSKVWAESVRMAIDEDRATQLIRRKHNLEWANSRSWSKRTANLQDFFHILSKKP